MTITRNTLIESWRQAAASHPSLRDAPEPHLADTEDDWDAHADRVEQEAWEAERNGEPARPGGLSLYLDADGTVHGRFAGHGEYVTTRDPEQVRYLLAETAIRERTGDLAEVARTLDGIDPAWGRRFRDGGLTDRGPVAACGRDPLEGLAWIAKSWRQQSPYTCLAFFRAAPGRPVDAERLALLYGADPAQVAAGTRLRDIPEHDDRQWQSCCYGQAGGWTYLLHHETPPGGFADKEAYAALGITESVWLTATSAKAIYTFQYIKDGRSVDDGTESALELLGYEYGLAPYRRGGELDFLNRAIRRAELDHPGLTDTYALYFHALETSLGLSLPRRDFAEGTARCAYWAGVQE
jgi:hypothetical protein